MNVNRKTEKMFQGKRRVFTYTQKYAAPVEKVFPLLCPVREYEYLPSWECELIYLASGYIEEGGIFKTRFPRDGAVDDIWVVSKYIPNRAIQFVRVNQLRAIIYNIEVRDASEPGTTLFWQQMITGLDDEGNRYVEALSEDEFAEMMQGIETLLGNYLDHGVGVAH